ncbi:lysozyme inhibitor LprI family protein [Clostridium fessum]|uniref:lysozyme inhibitor LprI family protein n=1 Tax=Clostridium fessum TaxID=2126740 RepID=UPI00399ACF91
MELYLLREARPPGQVQARPDSGRLPEPAGRDREYDSKPGKLGSANTTDAMREAVAYEYRLWDAELNQIYQAIMAVLPDEETDTLRGRERRWIRERDTAAKQAAERYKGGTMENVEYTASLANSTRDRAYELLDLYESYLPAE